MLDNLELTDFVTAGYTLMRIVPREDWMSAELLPEQIISLSHLGRIYQISWGWDVDQNRDELLEFGVEENLLEEFASWNRHIAYDDDTGFPTVFDSLEKPRTLLQRFITLRDEIMLIGVGLHKTWIDENRDKIPTVELDYYFGVTRMILAGIPLQEGGIPLGHEVAGFEFGPTHSWLCSGLDRDMHQLFGIRPGAWGLLQSYADAKRIVDWIDDGDVGTRGESISYYPWLIVQYPLEP